jgi:ankyrin repeat protein
MWIPMESNILEQRSRSDPILRGKIHRMRGMFKFYSVEPKDPTQQRVRQWIAAVRSRDVEAMEKLIGEDAGVMRSTDWLGRTPLHWATMYADEKFLRRVLGLPGARDAINVADDDGWTPLHIAGFMGKDEIVSALLEAGADAGVRDKRKLTSHDWALAKANLPAARLLESPAKR